MKTMKITISGNAGSGKSTVGKMLAEKLGVDFLSVGELSRRKALELGMDINQFQEYLKYNKEFDRAVDRHIVDYARSQIGYVLDYRLGFHFLPESFKVLLKVSEETALHRISSRSGKDEDYSNGTISDNLLLLKNRNELMRNRFIDIYGADFSDENKYDLVIDTDSSLPQEIVEIICGW